MTARALHWRFHYAKRLAFAPPDYDSPGLGGSEGALVTLTRALARRGHRVDVFNACWAPGIYDGVHWRLASEIANQLDVPDVAVAVRFEESLWTHCARTEVFWMLDDRTAGPLAADRRSAARARVVASSDAQLRRLVASGCALPVARIPLPIDLAEFRSVERELSAGSLMCLYCSMPNRGLDVLLKIWPAVVERVPEARLVVTSGWRLWGYTLEENRDRWTQFLAPLGPSLPPNVEVLGAVPRSELRALQARAALALYPCRFPEMFCLAAAECTAAGVPLVASSIEALSERVKQNETGILVPGNIDTPSVQADFAHAIAGLLLNPERRRDMAVAARQHGAEYEAGRVAAEWDAWAAEQPGLR